MLRDPKQLRGRAIGAHNATEHGRGGEGRKVSKTHFAPSAVWSSPCLYPKERAPSATFLTALARFSPHRFEARFWRRTLFDDTRQDNKETCALYAPSIVQPVVRRGLCYRITSNTILPLLHCGTLLLLLMVLVLKPRRSISATPMTCLSKFLNG